MEDGPERLGRKWKILLVAPGKNEDCIEERWDLLLDLEAAQEMRTMPERRSWEQIDCDVIEALVATVCCACVSLLMMMVLR